MAAVGKRANHLHGRTYYAQYPSVWRDNRQVTLLNGAQSLSGSCVTSENNEMAPHVKEFHNSLTRELIYHIEAA